MSGVSRCPDSGSPLLININCLSFPTIRTPSHVTWHLYGDFPDGIGSGSCPDFRVDLGLSRPTIPDTDSALIRLHFPHGFALTCLNLLHVRSSSSLYDHGLCCKWCVSSLHGEGGKAVRPQPRSGMRITSSHTARWPRPSIHSECMRRRLASLSTCHDAILRCVSMRVFLAMSMTSCSIYLVRALSRASGWEWGGPQPEGAVVWL